jgi:transposase-like protein
MLKNLNFQNMFLETLHKGVEKYGKLFYRRFNYYQN